MELKLLGRICVRKGEKRPDLWRARIGNCLVCSKEFRAVKDFKERKQKYCSKKCWSVRSPKIKIKCQYCNNDFMEYKNRKVYCNQKCRDSHYKIRRRGELSHKWKGDLAGYSAVHKQLTVRFGKQKYCDVCWDSPRFIDWANLSTKYKRDRSDWLRLCRKCHKWLDTRNKTDRSKLISSWLKIKRNGEEIEWATT